MGMLDFLSGGGSQNGMLDFLRQNALNQQMQATGAPGDTANYGPSPQPVQQPQMPSALPFSMSGPNQPSPLDAAQYPSGPVGAPSSANAAMQPKAAPMSFAPQPPQNPPPVISAAPAAQPGPGIGDRIGAAMQTFAHGGGLLPSISAGFTGQREDAKGTAQQLQKQALSANAAALQARGVDPTAIQAAVASASAGNSDPLKILFTQAFGPQTVQSLGNGYVADKSGKITRAYEPEDKIPSGFAKDDQGNLKFIPGGPADPAYQRLIAAKAADPNAVFTLGRGGELYKKDAQGNVTVIHKNEADAEATLDDATTGAMAAQYLAGDKSVMQNLGRGAQGAANIVKLRGEIYKQAGAQGLDGKAIVNNFNEQAGALAGQRSIGTRAANISLAANEANNMIPIALDASAKVPRGEWMPWNKMVQAYQTGSSSPELARFVAATNSLVNSYVRAVSPSGVPTDSMREHAYSMLNSAQSPQAYQAVTSIMQDEMKAAMAAPGQVRKELRHEDSGAPVAGALLQPGQTAVIGDVSIKRVN